jgi:hypothetical protein
MFALTGTCTSELAQGFPSKRRTSEGYGAISGSLTRTINKMNESVVVSLLSEVRRANARHSGAG